MLKSIPIILTLTATTQAELLITEVMSSSSHFDPSRNGDWWELTNTGPGVENLGNMRWHDNGQDATQLIFPNYSIQVGESVVILREDDSADFKSAWGLGGSIKVFVRDDFGGAAEGDIPGFSSGGDSVFLFSSGGSVEDSFTFGPATEGSSFALFNDGAPVPGGISIDGQFEAFDSFVSPNDTASPGIAAAPPAPLPPAFTGVTNMTWLADLAIDQSEFRVVVIDPNATDTVTLTADSKPDWLTVTDLGDGIAQFSGTPTAAQIGSHTVTMRAVDSGGSPPVIQDYRVDITPVTSPVILNEYNAVADSLYLGGGDDGDSTPADSFFGRVPGNGNEWLEFIVVGDGGAGEAVDLRGWAINITNDGNTATIKLSTHEAWAAIPSGTILTFSQENNPATGFNKRSLLNSAGHTWSHVWMSHPYLIDLANSSRTGKTTSSENTLVTLKDQNDNIIYGPMGESVAGKDNNANMLPDSLVSVNDLEVFKLEEDASPNVTPLAVTYDDGTTSTFSFPNKWNSSLSVQSFSNYVAPGTPPSFGATPREFAAQGAYSETLSATSGGASAPTIETVTIPDFLTLTTMEPNGNSPTTRPATLTSNRPLTTADIGFYEVTLKATDSSFSAFPSYLTYQLHVYHPASPILLNEANAVAPDAYLNGGNQTSDSDGPPASADSHFGRVLANGGDWVEFAVVGDGTPGAVDMRGWIIEIGKPDDNDAFKANHTITLTQDSYWAQVPTGTILTFIDTDTGGGGLDTDLNRVDMRTTEGWTWTNIYLGDSALVTGSDLTNITIDSSRTQFLVKDATNLQLFGPAGEGISPLTGISDTEIIELESDPSPTVSPRVPLTEGEFGYDDGSSGSTFGAPNLFTPAGVGEVERAQDFSAFISTSPLPAWAASFGIAVEDLGLDPDSDGSSSMEEYLYGGSPIDTNSSPIISIDTSTGGVTFDVRNDDPSFTTNGERSSDLESWITDSFPLTNSEASPIGASYDRRTYTYDGNEPKMFFRVFTPQN